MRRNSENKGRKKIVIGSVSDIISLIPSLSWMFSSKLTPLPLGRTSSKVEKTGVGGDEKQYWILSVPSRLELFQMLSL
jgi:hypothetical protein